MKDLIPRQMFDVAIQGGNWCTNHCTPTVKVLRKNVLAKCYGGDVSVRKIACETKEGKKRMKQVGSVEIPQSPAFLAVLQVDKK